MSCDRATAAIRWFLQSGIQEQGGGVARYYRADLGQNARVSTEITGYAVSSLVYLYRKTGDEEALAGACRAADFLVDTAWHQELGIFPFEHGENVPEALAYFFDSGIIARGLLAVHRATRDSRYGDAAVRVGESMARHFVSPDAIHPILRLPSFEPLPYTSQWSRGPGCYQLKSAMAWYDLGMMTGDARFTNWYERALTAALASHRSFLPAETPEKTMDRLHAYSYFLEALMPVADRDEIRPVLREGIGRVAGYLREIRPVFERSDVYGQLLRVRLLAERYADIAVARADAEHEAAAIPTFQMHDASDPRIDGGYAFGRRAGAIIPHVNPVSAAFCSQALEMWRDYTSGQSLDFESLV
jgi:hypothetical protein